MVYRCRDGTIGMPATNFKASMVARSRSVQDPRSPRKSAMDLFKSGILCVPANEKIDPINASFGVKTWEFEDRRRAVIQRAAITRVRPALLEGWKLEYVVHVIAPEYISEELLQLVAQDAGRFCGLGDNRPDYGRFRVTTFERIKLND